MTLEKKQEFTLKISEANKTQMITIIYEMVMYYLDEAIDNIGIGKKEDAIKSLMRAEWGFEGLVSTKKLVSSEGNILDMLKAGSDIFFDPCTGRVSDRLRIAYRNDPAAVSNLLREAVHRICYTIANRMYIY